MPATPRQSPRHQQGPIPGAARQSVAVLLLASAASALALTPAGAAHPPRHLPSHGAVLNNPVAEPQPIARPDLSNLRAYSGSKIDVTNYHYDNNRTGWNPTETDLTPASVASSKFGLLKSLTVDGIVFAQPMLVSNLKMPDGSTHDVLIVATEHDSVYAFDAATYATLWQVSLGKSQSWQDVGCGDLKPEYGISASPIILRQADGSATLYVIAATEPNAFEFHSTLHAINVATGADARPAVEIAPSATLSDGRTISFDPRNQWSRASMAYGSKSLYVSVGSHCDNNAGNISGWILRYGTDLKLIKAFNAIRTDADYKLSSIWMAGFAPAIDGKGNLFVVTGNGDRTPGAKNWGESVLRLPPTLTGVSSVFTPANYGDLNSADTDFGSGGVMLLPSVSGQTAPATAVAIGKDSVMYVLNQASLGGLKTGNSGVVQSFFTGGGGVWGGSAYYNGPAGATVYSQSDGDVLHAYHADPASGKLSLTVSGTTYAGYGGSLPIISSNGAAANTAVVWLIRRANPIVLEAYDAVTLGAPIYSATAGIRWPNSDLNPFLTAVEANGRVYVPGNKTLKIFGLVK